MNEEFAVKYSDGKTSKLYEAKLHFLVDKIGIEYVIDDRTFVSYWDVSAIVVDKYGPSFDYKLCYGEFPFQSIELSAEIFKKFSETYSLNLNHSRSNILIKHKTWKTISISLAVVVLFLSAMYFYVVPSLAETAAGYIPIEVEQSLGEKIYEQNMLPFEVDSVKTELLKEYFATLKIQSEYDVKVTVVNSPIRNAFAMPGGYIVVFSGLIDEMKHHEELAGVLAHEYAHVHFRHSLTSMARSLANYAVISLVFGDVSGLAGVLVENADYIQSMRYSRELETQADEYAFTILQAANTNPQGMVWLFETLNNLQKESDISIDLPEFMSSHPETMKRIDAMKTLMKENKQTYIENEKQQEIWGMLKR